VKDLRFVKEILMDLDPTLRDDWQEEGYQAALILLSSLQCGSDPGDLAAFTRLPWSVVIAVRQRMITAELWSERTVCRDIWLTKDGGFEETQFWMDVLVAEGLVERRWVEEEGVYRYFAKNLYSSSRKATCFVFTGVHYSENLICSSSRLRVK